MTTDLGQEMYFFSISSKYFVSDCGSGTKWLRIWGQKFFFWFFSKWLRFWGDVGEKKIFRKNFENFYKFGQVTTVLCLCSKISKFGEIARLWTTRFENFPSIKNVQVSFFFWSWRCAALGLHGGRGEKKRRVKKRSVLCGGGVLAAVLCVWERSSTASKHRRGGAAVKSCYLVASWLSTT